MPFTININDRGDLPKPDTDPLRIKTPHAALLIWNYENRLSSYPKDSTDINAIERLYVASTSCISIRTSKSKGEPQGTFQVELAPTKNWISLITPGSWCVVLMSNEPITKDDLKNVDAAKLKMFGKIDTVRLDTRMTGSGARTTVYNISGIDWCHVFNNTIYIESNLEAADKPKNLGSLTALAIQKLLFGKDGAPIKSNTDIILKGIMKVFGKPLEGFSTLAKSELKLLANAIYDFNIPKDVVRYLNILGENGHPSKKTGINSMIKLISGVLSSPNEYNSSNPAASGFIDPFTLQGTNSFWQVLQSNSCSSINEMIAEMRPSSIGTSLILYNRVKPFTIKGTEAAKKLLAASGGSKITSYFQDIKTHELDPHTVFAINAGTNWQDKVNFAEIKPTFNDVPALDGAIKRNSQTWDEKAFFREGFRPLIYTTQYLPGLKYGETGISDATWSELQGWTAGLRAWYFDTHKMLNGTIGITGIDGYIAVGDNIKLDSKLVNPSGNFNAKQLEATDSYLLAHVESVSHTFTVDSTGARSYNTQIQFTRGIIVNASGGLLSKDVGGGGAVDSSRKSLPESDIDNRDDTFFSSTSEDPDPDPGGIK